MSKSLKVDDYISKQPQWQQKNLELFRELAHGQYGETEEDIKWNVPVFMVDGKVLFAISTFKSTYKIQLL